MVPCPAAGVPRGNKTEDIVYDNQGVMTASPAPADPVVIKGGNQECRGASIGKNHFYVENIEEELDVEREWFVAGGTLLYVAPNDTAHDVLNKATEVVGAVHDRVVEVKGAEFITFRGFTIADSAPTYTKPYECPSGGDWAIHRGAAFFVENASNIVLEGITFDQPGGNAVMFSNRVLKSTIRGCYFQAHTLLLAAVLPAASSQPC